MKETNMNTQVAQEKLYSIKEAAAAIGCSHKTVDNKVRWGKIPRVWSKDRWLVPQSAVTTEKAHFDRLRETGGLAPMAAARAARLKNLAEKRSGTVSVSKEMAAPKADMPKAAVSSVVPAPVTAAPRPSPIVPSPAPMPDKLTILLRLTDALSKAKAETMQVQAALADALSRLKESTETLTVRETELAEAKQTIEGLQQDLDEATKPRGEPNDLTQEEVTALQATGLFPELG